MPAAVAIPLALGAGTAAAGAIGAGLSAGASKSAANTQANAALQAAQIQSKTAADTLAFQKQQAAQDLATQNAIQQANYNQWAAGQQRTSNFAQMLGLPAFNIPAYQPIPNTLGATATAPTASTGLPSGATTTFPTTPSGGSPTDTSAIQSALEQNYKALGVTPTGQGTGPTDIAYYAQKIAETGGLTPQNFSYWFGPTGRIATDLKGPSGGTTATASASPAYASNLSQLTPQAMPYTPVSVAGSYTPTPSNFSYLLGR